MSKLKIQLLTDMPDADIAQTFYAQRLNLPAGKPAQWGVFAQDMDTDNAALIAVFSGHPLAYAYAKCLSQTMEEHLLVHVAYERGAKQKEKKNVYAKEKG